MVWTSKALLPTSLRSPRCRDYRLSWEVLPLFKFNSNNADDFTVAHTEVIKPLTRCGSCVLVVDHLAKGSDSRSFGPTGTAAKSAPSAGPLFGLR